MRRTGIQWTDATVNFWHGCQKVSEGCKFCYMYRDKETLYGGDPTSVLRTSDSTFYKALSWKQPKRIFTCSWSDFFIDAADGWRSDAWDVIRSTPQHSWQILTKRPDRIRECLPPDWGDGYDNVWLGVSIENQKNFYRAVTLSKIPAKTRFISAEPLIEKLNLMPAEYGSSIIDQFQWCIIGGESGNDFGNYRYRECKVEWIEHLIAQLSPTGVAVFVKQLGTHLSKELNLKDKHGGRMKEWAEHLRIRQFPQSSSNNIVQNQQAVTAPI